jgi:hypothetical protein
MLKMAVIATRGKSQTVFGPFSSHTEAEQFEAYLAANTEIVNYCPRAHRNACKLREDEYK